MRFVMPNQVSLNLRDLFLESILVDAPTLSCALHPTTRLPKQQRCRNCTKRCPSCRPRRFRLEKNATGVLILVLMFVFVCLFSCVRACKCPAKARTLCFVVISCLERNEYAADVARQRLLAILSARRQGIDRPLSMPYLTPALFHPRDGYSLSYLRDRSTRVARRYLVQRAFECLAWIGCRAPEHLLNAFLPPLPVSRCGW